MSRLLSGRRLDSLCVSISRDSLCGDQEIRDVVTSFVDIRIDAVRRQVPGFGSESDTDVSTDLADPNRLLIDCQRRGPESQVNTFINA